ncbi:MaoC family dehydratase N-terminal domain-containing protein [Streptomyces sp. F63]|uniref:FAS1-like dehydratase domain-containing protein n=1 Tax=Streptomyces sp. F63 TaxID=2824887 RepID=UPI001B375CE3|nr:MaoC family dehydratase N-terminal domain-containing protein [Streptomyces sp. F63]MBQ0983210.1 MaoC family dehydratase N-terminal domain-containing protein [Streptomyces sp. F63]
MLNRSYAGREIRPLHVHRVTEAELVAFADAVGESHPACRSAAAAARLGHPAVLAVPTYTGVLALRAERVLFDDPDLGADPASLRHRESRITAHRPVYAGDLLTCSVRVSSIEQVGANELLVTEVAMRAGDEPVALVRNTVVMGGA